MPIKISELNFDKDDFGLIEEELQAKYGDAGHPYFTLEQWREMQASGKDADYNGYWDWVSISLDHLDVDFEQAATNTTDAADDITDITSVEQFGQLFGIWHGRMMERLRNLRDIPYGTEVTMTDPDGKETTVKLKGDGMLGYKAALNTAIAELEATPFVMSLEDAPEAANAADANATGQ